MNKKVYVDGMLVQFGEPLFNQSPVKVTKPSKGITGVLPKKKPSKAGGGVARGGKVGAKEIRHKLGAIAKRTPEVMVKISGGGKGMKQIRDHIDYISRNGKIELEDQDGNRINGVDELRPLRDEWQYGGFAIPEQGDRREAFNLVLSMPAGTDELGVKRAARDFAQAEFGNHQYVMALHTFTTDPDPHPSKNPHVHLTVKATSLDGTRLNPRKADLQRWREGFAQALRENGIEAAATNRQQRLSLSRGEKQSVRQMKDRGVQLERVGRSPAGADRVAKAKRTEAKVLQGYREIAKALAQSDTLEDRSLAVAVVSRLSEAKNLPISKGKGREVDGKDADR